jgi:hypothetical protein
MSFVRYKTPYGILVAGVQWFVSEYETKYDKVVRVRAGQAAHWTEFDPSEALWTDLPEIVLTLTQSHRELAEWDAREKSRHAEIMRLHPPRILSEV